MVIDSERIINTDAVYEALVLSLFMVLSLVFPPFIFKLTS